MDSIEAKDILYYIIKTLWTMLTLIELIEQRMVLFHVQKNVQIHSEF